MRGVSPYPLFWFDFSINLLMIIAIGGMPERRWRWHNVQRAPRSDGLFLSRISTEPLFFIFFVIIKEHKKNCVTYHTG